MQLCSNADWMASALRGMKKLTAFLPEKRGCLWNRTALPAGTGTGWVLLWFS